MLLEKTPRTLNPFRKWLPGNECADTAWGTAICCYGFGAMNGKNRWRLCYQPMDLDQKPVQIENHRTKNQLKYWKISIIVHCSINKVKYLMLVSENPVENEKRLNLVSQTQIISRTLSGVERLCFFKFKKIQEIRNFPWGAWTWNFWIENWIQRPLFLMKDHDRKSKWTTPIQRQFIILT